MYLGEDFREEEISRNMRAISSREDDQVRSTQDVVQNLLISSTTVVPSQYGGLFDSEIY